MAKKQNIINSHITIDLAILILRIGFGLLMLPHGIDKLGNVLKGDFGFADPIGIGEKASLLLTIFAELVCSIFLIIGLLTRPAALILAFTMFVAFFIVHAADEFKVKEHALFYLIPYLSILLTGPGSISLDFKYLSKWV